MKAPRTSVKSRAAKLLFGAPIPRDKIPSGTPAQRRKFLADQKPLPLAEAEYIELEKLIDDAGDSNRDVFTAAKEVGDIRVNLAAAEARLADARARNVAIHTALAPLFHRLPA